MQNVADTVVEDCVNRQFTTIITDLAKASIGFLTRRNIRVDGAHLIPSSNCQDPSNILDINMRIIRGTFLAVVRHPHVGIPGEDFELSFAPILKRRLNLTWNISEIARRTDRDGDGFITWEELSTFLFTHPSGKNLALGDHPGGGGDVSYSHSQAPMYEAQGVDGNTSNSQHLRHRDRVNCILVAPQISDTAILTAGADGSVRAWHRVTGDYLATIHSTSGLAAGGTHSVSSMAVTPTTRRLVCCQTDSSMFVYNVHNLGAGAEGGGAATTSYCEQNIGSAALVRALCGGRWTHDSRHHLLEYTEEGFETPSVHKRRRAILAGESVELVAKRTVRQTEPVVIHNVMGNFFSVCCPNREGQFTCSDPLLLGLDSGEVALLSLGNITTRKAMKPVRMWAPHKAPVTQLILSEDAHSFISSSMDCTVQMTSTERNAAVLCLRVGSETDTPYSPRRASPTRRMFGLPPTRSRPTHTVPEEEFTRRYHAVTCVDYSHPHGMLATCGSGRRGFVWSVLSPKPIGTLAAQTAPLVGVKLRLDHNQLITASEDRSIYVYDVRTYRVVQCIVDSRVTETFSSVLQLDDSTGSIITAGHHPYIVHTRSTAMALQQKKEQEALGLSTSASSPSTLINLLKSPVVAQNLGEQQQQHHSHPPRENDDDDDDYEEDGDAHDMDIVHTTLRGPVSGLVVDAQHRRLYISDSRRVVTYEIVEGQEDDGDDNDLLRMSSDNQPPSSTLVAGPAMDVFCLSDDDELVEIMCLALDQRKRRWLLGCVDSEVLIVSIASKEILRRMDFFDCCSVGSIVHCQRKEGVEVSSVFFAAGSYHRILMFADNDAATEMGSYSALPHGDAVTSMLYIESSGFLAMTSVAGALVLFSVDSLSLSFNANIVSALARHPPNSNFFPIEVTRSDMESVYKVWDREPPGVVAGRRNSSITSSSMTATAAATATTTSKAIARRMETDIDACVTLSSEYAYAVTIGAGRCVIVNRKPTTQQVLDPVVSFPCSYNSGAVCHALCFCPENSELVIGDADGCLSFFALDPAMPDDMLMSVRIGGPGGSSALIESFGNLSPMNNALGVRPLRSSSSSFSSFSGGGGGGGGMTLTAASVRLRRVVRFRAGEGILSMQWISSVGLLVVGSSSGAVRAISCRMGGDTVMSASDGITLLEDLSVLDHSFEAWRARRDERQASLPSPEPSSGLYAGGFDVSSLALPLTGGTMGPATGRRASRKSSLATSPQTHSPRPPGGGGVAANRHASIIVTSPRSDGPPTTTSRASIISAPSPTYPQRPASARTPRYTTSIGRSISSSLPPQPKKATAFDKQSVAPTSVPSLDVRRIFAPQSELFQAMPSTARVPRPPPPGGAGGMTASSSPSAAGSMSPASSPRGAPHTARARRPSEPSSGASGPPPLSRKASFVDIVREGQGEIQRKLVAGFEVVSKVNAYRKARAKRNERVIPELKIMDLAPTPTPASSRASSATVRRSQT